MSIFTLSRQLARLLKDHDQRLVLAESCTAGLVAASLSKIPGISNYLCGSMVTYRNEEKAAWLGISPEVLEHPGPVSEEVARLMVLNVLDRTEEASLAASVTGHLGPNAPAELDGVVFIGVADRQTTPEEAAISRYICGAKDRASRQREVVEEVLGRLAEHLQNNPIRR
jgi:PncC family amidohydrolase